MESKSERSSFSLEAVLLTGGASRRVGEDKAKLLVEGEPLARRISRLLIDSAIPVTVLGGEPLPDCEFLADEEAFRGPLAAISRFIPSREYVFVCSCDVPGFSPELILD